MSKITRSIMFVFALFLAGCSASVSHIPHQSLEAVKGMAKLENCVVVADIGDIRDNGQEGKDSIGMGVSYWLPISYSLVDDANGILHVSQFVADSIVSDLKYTGYDARLLNLQRNTVMSFENALSEAQKSDCNYLVTSQVFDGKTNYWGFIVIPFMEPVWTKIGIDMNLVNLKQDLPPTLFKIEHSDTEWYFGKITIFDAIFDAGLFGSRWMQKTWGETVVAQGIADGVTQVHKQISKTQVAKK